jgi:hypothetical protein
MLLRNSLVIWEYIILISWTHLEMLVNEQRRKEFNKSLGSILFHARELNVNIMEMDEKSDETNK